jgi:hypothetical protein
MDPDCLLCLKTDRPDWSVFGCIYRENSILALDGETGDFSRRKTGLFKPVWIHDLK